MGKKLYVGNLSYDVDSSELEKLFQAHGTVSSAQIISDRETGRSKGFGFVEMNSDDEATAATRKFFLVFTSPTSFERLPLEGGKSSRYEKADGQGRLRSCP